MSTGGAARVTRPPRTRSDSISVRSAPAAVTDHSGLIDAGSTTRGHPCELAAFIDHVGSKGRFRTEHSGRTQRDRLGLARPSGR
ncbi:hypothetical protein [Kutzneria sp. NPDC052558]|uniref:hypothetical protein n=1 Tax=Kutzneria sp. NPDC052558 TaxID=3364121 RepID=UPI0037C8E095